MPRRKTSPTPTPTPTPSPAPTAFDTTGYRVRSYSAAGIRTGEGDQIAKLQALWSSLANGDCLVNDIPAPIPHSTEIAVPSRSGWAYTAVDGAIHNATTGGRSALLIGGGSNIKLDRYRQHSIKGLPPVDGRSPNRLATQEARGIYLNLVTGAQITLPEILDVWNAGILLRKVSDVAASGGRIDGSLADGFHICAGSSNVIVSNFDSDNTGDDAFASISGAVTPNEGIWFRDCRTKGAYWASGVSFEGSLNSGAQRVAITGSAAAAVRVDSQDPTGYNTGPCDNILLEDLTLTGCVTRTGIGHGQLMLYANNYSVHGVVARRIQIISPVGSKGVRAYGKSSTQNVVAAISELSIDDPLRRIVMPFDIGAYASVSRSGNTLNGAPC